MHWTIYVAFVAIILLLCFEYNLEQKKINRNLTHSESPYYNLSHKVWIPSTAPPTENIWLESINSMEPRKFVFLNVHKTGSEFIAKILEKYAEKNNFTGLKSLDYGDWIGGYPGPFNSEFYKSDYGKVDFITKNMVWDWSGMNKVLSKPKNHVTIGILRNPENHFKQSFQFYYLRHFDLGSDWFFNKRNGNPSFSSCAGEPVYTFMKGNENVTLNKLITSIRATPFKFMKSPFYWRHNNSQSYDFGIHISKRTAKDLLNDFDLILLMERMEESLVLLKSELNMEWTDLKLWKGQSTDKFTGNDTRMQLNSKNERFVNQNLINIDRELYELATEKFDEKVKDLGGSEFLISELKSNLQHDKVARRAVKKHIKGVRKKINKKDKAKPNTVKYAFERLRQYMNGYKGICKTLPSNYLTSKKRNTNI